MEDPPAGWTVWHEDPGGEVILAYRPDVFDGEALPAACLPTVYVTQRRPRARTRTERAPGDEWHVALFLEPEVRVRERDSTHEDRQAALAAARETAAAFARGDVDYRGAYQVPREAYFERLDTLTGDTAPAGADQP